MTSPAIDIESETRIRTGYWEFVQGFILFARRTPIRRRGNRRQVAE